MTPRLTYAILSMDAYNRGYEPAIEDLPNGQIGGATIGRYGDSLLNSLASLSPTTWLAFPASFCPAFRIM
jgi:hypothetical protein